MFSKINTKAINGSLNNQTQEADNDSIIINIYTRPTRDAVGEYHLNVTVYQSTISNPQIVNLPHNQFIYLSEVANIESNLTVKNNFMVTNHHSITFRQLIHFFSKEFHKFNNQFTIGMY